MLLELLAKIPDTFSFNIGRVFGIPIKIDISWFVIFLVVLFTVVNLLIADFPDESKIFLIFVAVIITLVHFAGLLLHELAHSLVAIRKGIKVESITLFVFGGLALLESQPTRAKDEFQIVIAGPLVTFLLAAIFFLLYSFLAIPIIFTIFEILSAFSLVLGIFNLIPVFPSDGGRILRAFLWHKQKDQQKATINAIKLSKYISYSGIFCSVYLAVTGSILAGVQFVLISWFIIEIAKEELKEISKL